MNCLRKIPNVTRSLQRVFENKTLLNQCPKIKSLQTINFNRHKSIFTKYKSKPVVYEKELTIAKGGSVELEVPFNVELGPTDIEDQVKDFDKATFKVVVGDGVGENDKKNCSFSADCSKNVCKFKGDSKNESINDKIYCLAEIPAQSAFPEIKTTITGSGSFMLDDLETKKLFVQTQSGDIACKNLKCEQIQCLSRSGNINSAGVLQGNIDIKTEGDGKITALRIQGKQVDVETNRGAIHISAIYSEVSNFRSVSGQVDLDNYHGNGTVKLKQGNINITGLDGSLRAEVESGSIDVQVSRLDGLYLVNKNGNINVKLPLSMRCRAELEGKDIVLEKRLLVQGRIKRKESVRTFSGFLGAGKGPLMIILAPKGVVNISIQDWMSSLALGGVIPEYRPEDPTKE